MYSAKFIKQVVREARKSSAVSASRKFEVSCNTVRKWIVQSDTESASKVFKENQNKDKKVIKADASLLPSERNDNMSKHSRFLEYCNRLAPFAKVAVKYCYLKAADNIPKWLLVAYDLKNGCLNVCFAEENNKSNKALYLLYVNNFLQKSGVESPGFISELQLAEITIEKDDSLKRMISLRINQLVSQLIELIENITDISELIIKTYIFLVDYNLSRETADFLHPPFILDNNLTAFDFTNNALMINTLSENARSEILNITRKHNRQSKTLFEFNNDRLLKIYGYFTKNGLENRLIEDKIIQDARNLQLMGELSRSELLLKTLLKNRHITSDGLNSLYFSYGLQKFRSGDYLSAVRLYKKCISGSRQTGNLKLEFSALRNICMLWLHQSQGEKAYRYLRMAQKTAKEIDDTEISGRYYHLSGYFYYTRREFKQALAEFELSAFYSKTTGSADYTNAINGVANSLISLKKYKKGLKFALLALDNNLKTGLKIPICISRITCAEIYFVLENIEDSEKQLLSNLSLLRDVNYPYIEFMTRDLYVKLLLHCGRLNEALQQFQWLRSCISSNNIPHLLNMYKELETKIYSIKPELKHDNQ